MKVKPKITNITFFVLSFLLFFIGFQFNAFRIVDHVRFSNFARPAESLAIGRMIKSGSDGVFSGGGLPGRCIPDNDTIDQVDYQYYAYKNGLECEKFVPYKSQTGGHAMVYSLLDRLLPFSKPFNLFLFRALNAALMALLLTIVVGWFYFELGLFPSILVIISILLTPWATLLSRNIWYALWTNFLPFAILLILLRNESTSGRWMGWKVGLTGTMAILINFIMNGYEWVSTTLIMAFMPFIYYYLKDRWQFRKLVARMLHMTAGIILSIGISFLILASQIASLTGRFKDGFDWLYFSFQKRTYGGTEEILNTDYADQVNSSLSHVIYIYLGGTAFHLPPILENLIPEPYNKIYFAQVILLFFIATLLCFLPTKRRGKTLFSEPIYKGLVIATWISALAPFSWFLIFKGHAYSHWHMNHITWFMPFCLFGFALTGLVIEVLIRNLRGSVFRG